jgi:hypothetical protein
MIDVDPTDPIDNLCKRQQRGISLQAVSILGDQKPDPRVRTNPVTHYGLGRHVGV